MTPIEYGLVILACLILSAFFSGSETALLRLRPEELEADATSGNSPGAVAARNLLHRTSRLLVTILLGNNVVNILGAACASALATYYFGQEMGIVISTVGMTILVLIFSEVLPKSIAARNPRGVSYLVALPLYLIHHSLFMVHWLFDKIVDPLVKRISRGEVERDSAEEVLRLARKMKQEVPNGSPVSIIAGAAGAAEMNVSEIMIPRTEIVAFPVGTDTELLMDKLMEEGHTRAPIYEGNLDKILGLVHIKDLIRLYREGGRNIHDILKPVLRVPGRKAILPLLGDMQHSFAHMAVIKDEFGVTLGLVTQEDILEEIVGEIRDEFDKDELDTIKKVSADTYEALGRILVIDFNRETNWSLEAEKGDTLGGLIYHILGRAPKLGDFVQVENYKLSVAGVSGNRITRVRCQQTSAPLENDDS